MATCPMSSYAYPSAWWPAFTNITLDALLFDARGSCLHASSMDQPLQSTAAGAHAAVIGVAAREIVSNLFMMQMPALHMSTWGS